MPETYFDPSTGTAPRDRLEAWQLAKVKTLLRAVLASNPFYRTRLQRAGFTNASDLNSLADFLFIDRRSYP